MPLRILNFILHALHLGIVLGVGIGWLFCETRLPALALQAVILFSWFALGPLSGNRLGFCLVTDIQWRLRNRLGLPERGGGYVKHLLDLLTGRDLDAALIDKWTMRAFFACLAANLLTLAVAGWC
jgi:hypothetical protein